MVIQLWHRQSLTIIQYRKLAFHWEKIFQVDDSTMKLYASDGHPPLYKCQINFEMVFPFGNSDWDAQSIGFRVFSFDRLILMIIILLIVIFFDWLTYFKFQLKLLKNWYLCRIFTVVDISFLFCVCNINV